jgi:uncharacterized protein YecE (DUF72 family)
VGVVVGTSGWQYRSWRGRFYPPGLAQKRWLPHFAEHFQTVEVNNTFYRLPAASSFASWAEQTPPDFRFALKLSRYLTHIRRLGEPEEAIALFLDRSKPLHSKLGPLLLQLPPTMALAVDRLRATLEAITSAGQRVAVEFRHASWYTPEVRALLEAHDAALCLADRDSRPITPLWRTASWGYVRMHAGRAAPLPCYGHAALEGWAHRILELYGRDAEVYVYFNNDPNGCAVRDASLFALEAARLSLAPTRVPPLELARVA